MAARLSIEMQFGSGLEGGIVLWVTIHLLPLPFMMHA